MTKRPTYRELDPVLRLLPAEPPDSFERLTDLKEQAWRGRVWLVMYGAGYDETMAWEFALRDNAEWKAMMADTLSRVDDADIPFMVKGRLDYEAGKSIVPEGMVH